ncbi:MAG: helix-turn-helix transcriptional regulator [Pseudomonadota bacterium]
MTEPTSSDPLLHRALGSPSRVRLLELLREAPEPLDARQLSERTALHPNTVRAHLARLEEAGLVRAETEVTGRRGRPRIVFAAVPVAATEEDGYRAVADVLADALMRRHEAEEPVDRVVGLLDELGFAPQLERSEAGPRILMRRCPLIHEGGPDATAVCPAHLGLIEDVLDELDAPEEVDHLEPFAEPSLCVLALRAKHR